MIAKLFLLSACITLTACGGRDADTPAQYSVTLTNVTAGQPLSPAVIVLHKAGQDLWQIGQSASLPLEKLAESGDASGLAMTSSILRVVDDAVLLPGKASTFDLAVATSGHLAISIASMLVNTNDAFTGITNVSLNKLQKGESISLVAPIYDAGTEANSEAMADVPGPAAGGEGFNSLRNDVDYVAYHPGVVSQMDGLTGSALDAVHRFDQGAVTIRIERRQ